MNKTIPCFICRVACKVEDELAIAKLCDEHDTPENRETMQNTPVHQLMNIIDEGIKLEVDKNKEATQKEIDKLKSQIFKLEQQLKNQPTEKFIQRVTEESSKPTTGNVNKYGEII